VLAWFLAVPLLLVALAVPIALGYARSDGGRAQIRRLLLAEARVRVPGLDLGRVDGGFLNELILRDIDLRDGDGRTAVHVDSLSVKYNLLALLHHTVAVRAVTVQGVRVLVRPETDGSLNVAHLIAAKAAPVSAAKPTASTKHGSSGAWRVQVDRLTVLDLGADVQTDEKAHPLRASLDLSARLSFDGQRVSASLNGLDVASDAGHLSAEGSATVDQLNRASARLADYWLVVSTDGLNPSALTPASPAGRLFISLAARGAGTPLSAGSNATVNLRVAPSEIAGIAVASGNLGVALDGARWRIGNGAIAGRGIGLTLAGHGDGANVALDVDATLKGKLPVPSGGASGGLRGNGRLAVHVAGTLPDANLTVDGNVTGLRAAEARVGAAVLHAQIQHPLSAPAGSLRLSARAVQLSPQAPRVDRLSLSAAGDRRGLRADAAVWGPRVRGGLRARGTLASGAADLTLQALSLDFATAAYRQTLALQHPARLRWRANDAITWDAVAVRGAGFRFTGQATSNGLYRLPGQRQQPLARIDLGLRQASINGLSPVDADLAATLSRRQASAHLTAAMPSARAQMTVDADLPVIVPAQGGAPRLGSRGPVRINLHTNDVNLRTVPLLEKVMRQQGVSGGVASLDVAVSGDAAHPDVKAGFALRDVMFRSIHGLGRDSRLKTVAGLGGSLSIETVPGAIHATSVLRIHGIGVLTADARTPLDVRQVMAGGDLRRAPVQATITIPTFSLASLAEFSDQLAGINGQLSGSAHITGTLARPSGSAELQVVNGKVDDLGFGPIKLTGQAHDGHVAAALEAHDLTGGSLTASALIERAEGDRVQVKVQARDLDLRFARVFVPTLRETAGIAQLKASVSGTVAAPLVNADFTVEKGRLGLIGQPTFHDLRLAATVRPGRATLARLEARSGDGSLSGDGWVVLDGLSPRQAVFKAHAHRFLVAAAGSTGALIDGDLAAEAALRADVLAGKVNVPRAQIWLPKGPGAGESRDLQKIGPHDDVHFVDDAALAAADRQRAGLGAPSTALKVGVRTGPIYIRGKDLDLELDSTLTIGSVPGGRRVGAPTVAGGISIRRGRINIQGQRFDFSRGEITFDGSPDINPRLDIILERQYPDALVQVALRGTPKKPELQMTSEPPVYDQAQIVSLILTGQPGGQPSTGHSFDPTAAVATAVLSKLADKLAPEVGLDVLRVENVDQHNEEGEATGAADTRIELGKYVSDRIYLSYAHVFGAAETENQNEAHVEYRLTRRWMLETIFGDAGVGGVDALWTVRY
jgi:autotransporter translocation and assembly factor TamB